jgi:hypothetical protein
MQFIGSRSDLYISRYKAAAQSGHEPAGLVRYAGLVLVVTACAKRGVHFTIAQLSQ